MAIFNFKNSHKCLAFLTISLLLVTAALTSGYNHQDDQQCRYDIVESMPQDLVFNNTQNFVTKPTGQTLVELLSGAQTSIKIASFYWSMTGSDGFNDTNEYDTHDALNIMGAIKQASTRGVKIEIVTDNSTKRLMSYQPDLDILTKVADIKYLDMRKLVKSGVLHTKFVLVDTRSYYLGSSNMDWRSYSHIKEIGVQISNCPPLAEDLDKIFRTYQLMADSNGQIPDELPDELSTKVNMQNPLKLDSLSDSSPVKVFMGAAPPAFNGKKKWSGRTDDIDGLISIIRNARQFVYISVMNYSPVTEFIWPRRLWSRIDEELRRAAIERNVQVKLLISHWPHTNPNDKIWARSLDAIKPHFHGGTRQNGNHQSGGIQVNWFTVPAFNQHQHEIPYARVKHDKYMVSDYGAYIGTSNWTPDYFINTCGIGFVAVPDNGKFGQKSLMSDMKNLFERDFFSAYSKPISDPVD